MLYQDAKGDGIMDFVFKDPIKGAATRIDDQTNAFLIEANVRLPGIGGFLVTLYTYRVDY
jgi:hypothetical protein